MEIDLKRHYWFKNNLRQSEMWYNARILYETQFCFLFKTRIYIQEQNQYFSCNIIIKTHFDILTFSGIKKLFSGIVECNERTSYLVILIIFYLL